MSHEVLFPIVLRKGQTCTINHVKITLIRVTPHIVIDVGGHDVMVHPPQPLDIRGQLMEVSLKTASAVELKPPMLAAPGFVPAPTPRTMEELLASIN